MQLAGLARPALRAERREPRTLAQKWDQIEAARALERAWTKAQILEAYLNLVVVPRRLDRACARRRSGSSARRRRDSTRASRRSWWRCCARPARAPQRRRAARVRGRRAVASPDVAVRGDSRARASVALAGGYRVAAAVRNWRRTSRRSCCKQPGETRASPRSTRDVQAFAIGDAARAPVAELAARDVEDGAVVVLDNATGDVLAYVGSSGELSRAPEVDGAARRGRRARR